MGGQQALEDLRSKIVASMSSERRNEQAGKRVASEAGAREDDVKRQRPIKLPTGPRNGITRSRYEPYGRGVGYSDYSRRGARADNFGYSSHGRSPPPPRYTAQQSSRWNRFDSHQEQRPSAPFHEDYLKDVEPIDKRKRLSASRWDVTPKGFEKVPAERAKLSGLFPQPGQPQELDRSKLERVALHGGSKSRRTRILFEDATSKNLVVSKLACELVVEGLDQTASESFSSLVQKFVAGLEGDMAVRKVLVPDHRTYAVVELGSAECATLVLSCRSFINKKLGLSLRWRRPNEYVQQLDHPDRLCSPEIIAVEGLEDGDETAIGQMLSDNGLKNCYLKPITSLMDGVPTFTGCALVELDNVEDDVLEKFKTTTSWFRPNQGTLVQESSSITFQSLPTLVSEQTRSESKVLVLLNCVDPLDLKLVPFAQEIEDTIKYTLGDVDTVRMRRPNADYRLNFDNISEGVGNIYVKFKTVEASIEAMAKLPGSKFNGRTVLCSYVSEEDFEKIGVL
ncbi:hypothetical protein HG536_0G00670 [Torulaspora globosa]|uniref:RNA recognition motif domain-containing protein n=1 Tax=Torulaspora globosa TaxID=48254 RepID=A0A7G3ZL24_9SACH|nr:uncharacterized protein HG536_0G00670 [Torulaspora globosa]QLL34210.1 hypothetical protein HG536_0G00670 [Torulaspora globosa]